MRNRKYNFVREKIERILYGDIVRVERSGYYTTSIMYTDGVGFKIVSHTISYDEGIESFTRDSYGLLEYDECVKLLIDLYERITLNSNKTKEK